MSLFLRIVSIVALLIFLISAAIASNLFWVFNFGACKDGCAQGMAYIYFLPAIGVAIISALIAIVTHMISKRMR